MFLVCRIFISGAILPTAHPVASESSKTSLTFRPVLQTALLSLLLLSVSQLVTQHPALPLSSLASSQNPPSPLLEILVLSHPRPQSDLSSSFLTRTIESYLPFTSSNVALSVFTHSTSNAAFEKAKSYFKTNPKNVNFFADSDSHPNDASGQYLHIAEAFRWVSNKPRTAEWIMLVEDDFPICNGIVGWNAVVHVMNILEGGRSKSNRIRGGFVGTGGRCVRF